MHDKLRIGGFVACSTQDWPDQLAAVVFVRGCPWRCCYCHNPHLQTREWADDRAWDYVEVHLQARRGLLDGVVFSGGEPTVDAALPQAIARVRELGMKVGLHTAGCYPERLAALLPMLDWVGLDIKAEAADYAAITGVPGSGEKAWESLRLLQSHGISHEVRITAHPDWLPAGKLDELLARLAACGVTQPVLQAARPAGEMRHGTPTDYLEAALDRLPPGCKPLLRNVAMA